MRRQYITHPKFQTSFTLSFVVGILIILTVLGYRSIATLYLLSKDPFLTYAQRSGLVGGASHLAVFIMILAFIFLVVFTLLGIFLSYKFVGPLSRVETWVEKNIEGEPLEPLTLRKGDELKPLVSVLARLFKKFK